MANKRPRTEFLIAKGRFAMNRDKAVIAGKKSGESRRKKRAMRQMAKIAMRLPVPCSKFTKDLSLDDTAISVVAGNLVLKAMNGDLKAFKILIDLGV